MGILDAPGITPAGVTSRFGAPLQLAFFGDSLPSYGEGYPYYLAALSMGRIQITSPTKEYRVVSYPGADTTTLLTHVSDITGMSPRPQAVVVQGGTNDAIASVSMATATAKLEAICAAFEGAGIRVIMSTIPPLGGGFQYNTLTGPGRRINIWIRKRARETGRLLVDPWTALVDVSNGRYGPFGSGTPGSYDSGDNVHPSSSGVLAWATRMLADLAPYLAPVPQITEVASGGDNLIPSSSFRATGGTWGGGTNAGLTSALASTTATTGVTPTLVPDAGPLPWNWQRLTLATAGGSTTLYTPATTPLTPGHLMMVACRYRSAQASGLRISVQFPELDTGGTVLQNHLLSGQIGFSQPVTDSLLMAYFTVGASTAKGWFQFVVPQTTNGTYDIAQPTVYDLTALGLAA